MNYLYLLIILLPLPMLLNRWRGTGTIFNIFGFKLIGNIIYAIYIAVLIGLATALNHTLLPFTTIVVNGDDYVFFETLEKVSQNEVDAAAALKEQKEKNLSVPASISRLQAKLQLLEIGLLDEVEDLVAQDRKIQLYWKEADNFYRTDSILLGMATAIGLTDEQLDELFIEASKLK